MIQVGKIMVLNKVRSDCPFSYHLIAEPGIYVPYLNRYGAVCVEINGEFLGLKPNEFKWIEQPSREVYENQSE